MLVALWQIALLGLIAAWLAQSAGVWFQMQHYQRTFSALREQWSDGVMGAGAAPSRFGKGVIALVIIGPDGAIRRTCLMQGRSVFAKFRDMPEFDGLSAAEVSAKISDPGFDKSTGIAIGKAIEQAEKAATEDKSGNKGVSAAPAAA